MERTLQNLTELETKHVELQFHVTNLINVCLGLIVFPNELSKHKIIKKMPTEMAFYEIQNESITYWESEEKSFQNILKHLRNGIAHGHIYFEDDGRDIKNIIIYDEKGKRRNAEFNFSVEEFEIVAKKIATEYLKTHNVNV